MNVGALQSTAPWLLFLHADSKLPSNYAKLLDELLASSPDATWATFRGIRVVEGPPNMGTIEYGAQLRTRFLGLPYGDQVLIVRRDTFFAVGMYRDLELMEDADLALRLGKQAGPMNILAADVETSGRRWKLLGKVTTTLLNWLIVILFLLGVDTGVLKKLYTKPPKIAQTRAEAPKKDE